MIHKAPLAVCIAFVTTWLVPAVGLAAGGGGESHHGGFSMTALLTDVEFWGAVVNFVLLLWVLHKLGRAPLTRYLSQRQRSVAEGMREAAEMKANAQKVYDEYTERLKTMDRDMEKLRRDIREAAEEDRKRILFEAEQAGARMRAETEALIEAQVRELSQRVQAEVAQAAVTAAEDVLRRTLSSQDQANLAHEFRQQLVHNGGRS